jgi:endonuclease-3 related protein
VSRHGHIRAKLTLLDIYDRMLGRYGHQSWWPADTRFEMMVGAVLTQAAAWTNVEQAIENLKAAAALSPDAIRRLPQDDLARLVYPTGYYNSKARKLKALAAYLGERFGDDLDAMARVEFDSLRPELLAVHGIGEETADDILLYALGKPVFVIDAFTRRLFSRLGLAPDLGPYSAYQGYFTEHLAPDPELFGEYHALIVRHAKVACRKRPVCNGCVLLEICPTGKGNMGGSE